MPVEDGVPMRKAAEAIDDRLVLQGIVRPLRVAELREQLHRQRLIGAIFAMLERQVEEHALLRRHADVETLSDRLSGKSPRDWIGRIGAGRIAEEISRELIEHDDGGEQLMARHAIDPLVCHEPLVQPKETLADLRIGVLALREPMSFAQLVEPEMQNLGYPVWLGSCHRAQPGSPAKRREEASSSAWAGILNGWLLMNFATEKSGCMDRHSATLALAEAASPSRA